MSLPPTARASTPSASIPSAATPPTSPTTTVNQVFFAQHQRLLIELLPFQGPRQFHEWLAGPYVSGAWNEYRNEFLAGTNLDQLEEPDKTTLCQTVRTVIRSGDPKFRVYRPDKTGWTAQDHTVRFVISVLWDNFFGGLWSVHDFNRRPGHYFNVVYEILSFLRASYVAAEAQQKRTEPELPYPPDEGEADDYDEPYDEPYDETLYDDGADDDDSDDDSDGEPGMGGPYARLFDGTGSDAGEGLLDTPTSSHSVLSRSFINGVADEERFDHW